MVFKKEMLWKNKLYFDQEEMLKNGLILHAYRFLDMPIPMATTFTILCNIIQNTTPEDNSQKIHQLYFFLMGMSRTFFE